MKPKPKKRTGSALANRIADALFTNGHGSVADRLQMMRRAGGWETGMGSGWGRLSVIRTIDAELAKERPKPKRRRKKVEYYE